MQKARSLVFAGAIFISVGAGSLQLVRLSAQTATQTGPRPGPRPDNEARRGPPRHPR